MQYHFGLALDTVPIADCLDSAMRLEKLADSTGDPALAALAEKWRKLARCLSEGCTGVSAWPAVCAVDHAGVMVDDWRIRRMSAGWLLHTCRMIGCPTPGTLGVMQMSKAVTA